MIKRRPRLYLDTSVFGGCLDDEFALESNRLLEALKSGQFTLLVSEVVLLEIRKAPPAVQAILDEVPEAVVEAVLLTEEVIELRDQYISEAVVTAKSLNDATHVAAATIARADAIVSWNFKHIVRFDRMKGFNRVNFEFGYGVLTIISPKEIVTDDDDT